MRKLCECNEHRKTEGFEVCVHAVKRKGEAVSYSDRNMYLVFDVGGTFIKYALMTSDGEIMEKNKIPADRENPEATAAFIEKISNQYHLYQSKYNIKGIAMGLPGQIDVKNGIVYGGGAHKYLDKVPLGKLISQNCDGIPVSLENDGKCAALAEVWKGNAMNVNDACVLVFGTGVGGGVIINRKVVHGKNLLAGEFSFGLSNMTRSDAENIVPCETDPSLETTFDRKPYMLSSQISASSITYRASQIMNLPSAEITGEMVYDWCRKGNREIADMLEDTYFSIAKLCMNIYLVYNPEIFLIGGGISAEPAFIEGIQRYIEKLKAVTFIYENIRVDTCRFRNDSNLLGALYNFKQLYEE